MKKILTLIACAIAYPANSANPPVPVPGPSSNTVFTTTPIVATPPVPIFTQQAVTNTLMTPIIVNVYLTVTNFISSSSSQQPAPATFPAQHSVSVAPAATASPSASATATLVSSSPAVATPANTAISSTPAQIGTTPLFQSVSASGPQMSQFSNLPLVAKIVVTDTREVQLLAQPGFDGKVDVQTLLSEVTRYGGTSQRVQQMSPTQQWQSGPQPVLASQFQRGDPTQASYQNQRNDPTPVWTYQRGDPTPYWR